MTETSKIQKLATLATNYCTLLENCKNFPKEKFIYKTREVLAGIYYEILISPKIDESNFYMNEHHVTEDGWNKINSSLEKKLGQHNEYQDVFDASFKEMETPPMRQISEDLTDIYQDIKNFAINCNIGNSEMINSALYELQENFTTYWGQVLTNVIRALHAFCSETENITEENNIEPEEFNENNINTDNWLISGHFNQSDNE